MFGRSETVADVGTVAAAELQVVPRRPLGCGEMGCAFDVDDGEVMKVTTDEREISAVEAIVEDGIFDGFPEVRRPPVRLRSFGDERQVYAYVREAVTPIARQDVPRPIAELLPVLIGSASTRSASIYLATLNRLAPHAPALFALGQRLFARGLLLADVHRGNLGLRTNGTIVAFDVQVVPA